MKCSSSQRSKAVVRVMNRQDDVLRWWMFAIMVLVVFAGSQMIFAEQSDKPNIIFIMVDDAGIGDFTSYMASSPVKTPNIDALAANGMRFTNAYASATVCGPARSGLMTGQHLGHASMRGNFNTAPIRDQDITIPEVLSKGGYASGGYGKWGLGAPGTAGAPERQGFDEFFGYYHQVHAHDHYPDRLYLNGETYPLPANSGYNEPSTGLVSDSRTHQQYVVVDRMKQFIASNIESETPFFAYGAWTLPHVKSTLPQAEAEPGGAYALYASKPWTESAKIQAAMMTVIDRHVGDIVELINDPNQDGDTSDSVANNTIIMFASDNGGAEAAVDGAWDRNDNLRGQKTSNYEGGLRTPFIAQWDGHIQPGSESDLLTYFPDLMATFAELGGVSNEVPSYTDGISIVPTLTGQGTQQEHTAIYFETPNIQPNGNVSQALRMGQWKALRSSLTGTVSLYDLDADPSESTNVAGDNPAVVAQMAAIMDASHTKMRPQFNVSPPSPGNSGKDGIITFGVRPEEEVRLWSVNESGDALSLSGQLRDPQGDAIGLYLDDLDQYYNMDVTVERVGEASPGMLFELVGQSGVVYFTATYNSESQAIDSIEQLALGLILTDVTPSASDLGSDRNNPLTLRISNDGQAGDLMVSDMSFAEIDVEINLLGDFNLDGQIDQLDTQALVDGWLIDFGVGSMQSYVAGDIDLNGVVDRNDWYQFRLAYIDANQTAPLLQTIPEPASLLLLGLGGLLFGKQSRRRLKHNRD